jgi:hypothetical protein
VESSHLLCPLFNHDRTNVLIGQQRLRSVTRLKIINDLNAVCQDASWTVKSCI